MKYVILTRQDCGKIVIFFSSSFLNLFYYIKNRFVVIFFAFHNFSLQSLNEQFIKIYATFSSHKIVTRRTVAEALIETYEIPYRKVLHLRYAIKSQSPKHLKKKKKTSISHFAIKSRQGIKKSSITQRHRF